MKFGFVTCVQLGKSCMDAIYKVDGKLNLVITLEDTQAVNKSGRVYLDDFCNDHNIPLLKSSHINNQECIDAIKECALDWLFIIGWSQIANTEILTAPLKGTLGIHPTLLPQGRGRASIPWAILKELDSTGVTMFKLDEGVDTGEIVEQLIIPLSKHTTATELYELVNKAHINLIEDIYSRLQVDDVILTKQDHSLATEWPGRGPADGRIDLDGSVYDAERLVRAVTRPYPGAFANIDGVDYIIWKSHILTSDCPTSENIIVFKDGILVFSEFHIKE